MKVDHFVISEERRCEIGNGIVGTHTDSGVDNIDGDYGICKTTGEKCVKKFSPSWFGASTTVAYSPIYKDLSALILQYNEAKTAAIDATKQYLNKVGGNWNEEITWACGPYLIKPGDSVEIKDRPIGMDQHDIMVLGNLQQRLNKRNDKTSLPAQMALTDAQFALKKIYSQQLKNSTPELHYLLTMNSVLVCMTGAGVISFLDNGQERAAAIAAALAAAELKKQMDALLLEYEKASSVRKKEIIQKLNELDPPHPVSSWQLDLLGWKVDQSNVEKLNGLLNKFDVTKPDSVLNFIVHCTLESGAGRWPLELQSADMFDYYKSMGMFATKEEYNLWRGSGYIQLTSKGNYEALDKAMREDLKITDDNILSQGAKYVSENYPWEASVIWWTKIGKANNKDFDATCYAAAGGGGRGRNYKEKLELRNRLLTEGFFN